MFGKWELYIEDVPMIMEEWNAFWGTVSKRWVSVDVYRKRRLDGTWKYKKVARPY